LDAKSLRSQDHLTRMVTAYTLERYAEAIAGHLLHPEYHSSSASTSFLRYCDAPVVVTTPDRLPCAQRKNGSDEGSRAPYASALLPALALDWS